VSKSCHGPLSSRTHRGQESGQQDRYQRDGDAETEGSQVHFIPGWIRLFRVDTLAEIPCKISALTWIIYNEYSFILC
jgi:hypothetical protein